MTELPSNSISQRTRVVGCTINVLVLLLLSSLFSIAGFVVPILGCALPLILIAGLIGAPLIGFRFGPHWWPKFYAWLESLPFLTAMIPGAVAAIVTGLSSTWALAIYADTKGYEQGGGTGAGATLLAMFIFSPAILLIGPVLGAAGGLAIAYIANRFGTKAQPVIWLCGLIGGGIAGLIAGVLPYALLLLSNQMTGNPGRLDVSGGQRSPLYAGIWRDW